MIFLDASVLLALEDPRDANHRDAVKLVRGEGLATLDFSLYEITNVCDRNWGRPQAGRRLRRLVWELGSDRIERISSLMIDRTAEIARQHEISAYDAAYVAAAERVGLQLVSCDVRDLVSKGLAVTPSEMLERLRDEADAAAVGDEAGPPAGEQT